MCRARLVLYYVYPRSGRYTIVEGKRHMLPFYIWHPAGIGSSCGHLNVTRVRAIARPILARSVPRLQLDIYSVVVVFL